MTTVLTVFINNFIVISLTYTVIVISQLYNMSRIYASPPPLVILD